MLFVNDHGQTATLCHYPMMSWPGMSKGGYTFMMEDMEQFGTAIEWLPEEEARLIDEHLE